MKSHALVKVLNYCHKDTEKYCGSYAVVYFSLKDQPRCGRAGRCHCSIKPSSFPLFVVLTFIPSLALQLMGRVITPRKRCDPEFAHITSTHIPFSGTLPLGRPELHGSLGNIISSWAAIFLVPQYVWVVFGIMLLLEGRRSGWIESEQCQPQHYKWGALESLRTSVLPSRKPYLTELLLLAIRMKRVKSDGLQGSLWAPDL